MNGWVRGGDYEDILYDTLDVQAENGTAGPGAGRIATDVSRFPRRP